MDALPGPRAILAALLVALSTGACGVDGGGNPPAQERVLVDYRVSGGLMGLSERLIVRSDGSAVLTSTGRSSERRRIEVSDRRMRRIRDGLNAARASRLRPRYELPKRLEVSDGIRYRISFGETAVSVEEAGVSPPALRSLHGALLATVMRHR